MRDRWISACLVGVLAFALLTGCATRAGVRRVERDLTATFSIQFEELRKLYESTNRELARMTEKVKELEASTARLAQAEQETAQLLSRAEAKLADAEATVRGLRTLVGELSREVSRLGARPSVPESPAREASVRHGSPEQLYAAAMANMRAREHGQAVLDFLDFIAKHPKHPLASNAQYWIGEAYYFQRDFRQALVEFQKVVEQYGTGNKAPDALLKIGFCYKALHEPRRAREAWERLIAEFPRSAAARKARALMQTRAASSAR